MDSQHNFLPAILILVAGIAIAWGLHQCSNSYVQAQQLAVQSKRQTAELAAGQQILADAQQARQHTDHVRLEQDRMALMKEMWSQSMEAQADAEQKRMNLRMLESQNHLMRSALDHHFGTFDY